MTKRETSALLLSLFAIIYVGCGRNELDDGFPTTNVDNGSGGTQGGGGSGGLHGSGGRSGSGGAVGGSSGSGGRVGSGGSGGTGGRVGSGGSGGTGGRVGSGGSGGSPGTGGSGGGSGGSVGGGISCGNLTCQSNKESCCIQATNGRPTETCIPAGAACQGGPSIGCLGGDCGDGRVCCFSLIGLNTTCTAAQQCNNGLSTVLCGSDRDCPAARNHCCQTGPISTCRASACGGGPGGAPTPGPGPGRPGR